MIRFVNEYIRSVFAPPVEETVDQQAQLLLIFRIGGVLGAELLVYHLFLRLLIGRQ